MNTQKLRNLCMEILEEGREKYNLILGIVSHIHDDQYEIFAVSSLTEIPLVGDIYSLNAVYCRQVYEQKRTVAITEIDNKPGMMLHPLYDGFPIEVYLSSPIMVDNEVWGTLNFTSLDIKKTPFSAEDLQLNESQANRIAVAISRLNSTSNSN